MLAPILTVFAGLAATCLAAPQVDSQTYFSNLASNLTAAGLGSFLNALIVANTTETGQKLINALYSDGQFTIFAPVDTVRIGHCSIRDLFAGLGSERTARPAA
jgi:hypothetical protein